MVGESGGRAVQQVPVVPGTPTCLKARAKGADHPGFSGERAVVRRRGEERRGLPCVWRTCACSVRCAVYTVWCVVWCVLCTVLHVLVTRALTTCFSSPTSSSSCSPHPKVHKATGPREGTHRREYPRRKLCPLQHGGGRRRPRRAQPRDRANVAAPSNAGRGPFKGKGGLCMFDMCSRGE